MHSFLFGGRSHLQKSCRCGNTEGAWCSETGLRNHRHFPPFSYLPDYDDIDDDYYGQAEGEYSYRPLRHWALVGEIVETNFFIRPRAELETHYGERVLVNFHLEDANKPRFFDWEDLKPKRTMCILYANNKMFLDMNRGIRQESALTVMVFPAPLEVLTQEVNAHALQHGRTALRRCFYCGTYETEKKLLRRCGRCRLALYCDKDECQRPHWKASHSSLCKHAQTLSKLAGLDFSDFQTFLDWTLVVRAAPGVEDMNMIAEKSRNEYLYRLGGRIQPMKRRLCWLLDSIGSKTFPTDPIGKRVMESEGGMFGNYSSAFSVPVKETFLCKSLENLMRSLEEIPEKRSHVEDLRFDSNPTEELISERLFNMLFFSIPQWQHEECIGGISWAFEAHSLFSSRTAYPAGDVWQTTVGDGGDSLMVKNCVSDTNTFLCDNIALTAELGTRMAKSDPDCMVVRVLRATANRSYTNIIQEIATAPAPNNLYTLWVREDVTMERTFNPPRDDLSLADQLLDTRYQDITELMLRRMGVPKENTILPESDDSEIGSGSTVRPAGTRRCAACGVRKTVANFSKTQLRKSARVSRCIECIASRR